MAEAAPPPQVALAVGEHRYPVRVYFEDTDASGVVYHAGYLRFAERARTETLRALGRPHAALMAEGRMFVVRRLAVDYQRPARLDDALEVRTRLAAMRGASLALDQQVWRGAERIARLEVELVCLDRASGRPERLPAEWRRALAALAGHGAGGDARVTRA